MARSADDLILFSHLVESGSYTLTAKAMGLQKSYVSRRIAALEAILGLQLLERSSRALRITELGRRVYEQARVIRSSRDEAFNLVDQHRGAPSGALSVVCPDLLAHLIFGRVAVDFASANPGVQLTFDVQTSTLGANCETYDLVIAAQVGNLPDSRQIARRIFVGEYVLVASPALVKDVDCTDLRAFARFPAVGWWSADPATDWSVVDSAGHVHSLLVHRAMGTNNLELACEAAKAGLGLARLPRALAKQGLASGTLVEVLPDYVVPAISVHVLYSSRRVLTAAGRAFIAAMETWVRMHGV
jgi:DNA-binding transcriptional LysR family regulator